VLADVKVTKSLSKLVDVIIHRDTTKDIIQRTWKEFIKTEVSAKITDLTTLDNLEEEAYHALLESCWDGGMDHAGMV
jgi:hypothetical protein